MIILELYQIIHLCHQHTKSTLASTYKLVLDLSLYEAIVVSMLVYCFRVLRRVSRRFCKGSKGFLFQLLGTELGNL